MSNRLFLTTCFLSLISFRLQAQVLEWSRVFEPHSLNAMAGISPHSLVGTDGRITTVVIESDTLSLRQVTEQGAVVNQLFTGKRCGEYTPIIHTGGGSMALVFVNQPAQNTFRLLQTDADLNVVRESVLSLPAFRFMPQLEHLISYHDMLFLTLFDGDLHYLCRIEDQDSVRVVYSDTIAIGHGEKLWIADQGDFLFSYTYGNNHLLHSVSVATGETVWEREAFSGSGFALGYEVLMHQDKVYVVGHERSWINGEAYDVLHIKVLEAFTGTVLRQTTFHSPGDCVARLNDLRYHPLSDQLYLCYSGCFPDNGVTLVEIDPFTLETVGQHAIAAVQQGMTIGPDAQLHIRADGGLALVYKSYKNEIEHNNLYIRTLTPALDPVHTFELNFAQRNGSESQTQLLAYDDTRMLITGIIPHPDPNIFWEDVRYFTAMIALDRTVPVGETEIVPLPFRLYPNPADDLLQLTLADDNPYVLQVFNSAGQVVYVHPLPVQQAFVLHTQTYPPGIYLLTLSGGGAVFSKRFVVK